MSSKSKTKQTNTLDPQYSALVYGAANQAQQLKDSYTPYSGQLVAGFNPTQDSAQAGLLDFAGSQVGSGLFDQASGAATTAAGYQPIMVSAQQINPQLLAGTDLSPYQNPYNQQVIDAFSSDANRQREIALSQARAQMLKSGAWGGSGGGVQQGQVSDNYDRGILSGLANLRQQGFTNAQDAARFDIGNRLTADQFNASGALDASLANQAAGLNGNAQRMQASGLLAGLSEQQRAQRLQDLGIIAGVGDTRQAQSQAELDAQHQAYLDEMQQRLALQQGVNGGVSLVPQTGTTYGVTKSSPGLSGILGGVGGLLSGVGALGGLGAAGGLLGGASAAYSAPSLLSTTSRLAARPFI